MELVSEVKVSLIQTNASDDMVAMAAWVSHDQDNEMRLDNRLQVKKLINFLYTNKHMSPFEHGQFTFKIDVPLFVAREFHRHRTFSYNEVSGRYTQMQPRFWVGTEARIQKGKPGDYYFETADNEQTAIYLQSKRKATKKAWKEYNRRLEAGIAKEQAREDLPLSLMTQFYATVNPRNLMAFLTLRNEKHALKEIQAVAVQMEEIFKEQMPLTYAAYAAQREREQNTSGLRVQQLEEHIFELKKAVSIWQEKHDELANRYILKEAETEALAEKLLELQQESVQHQREATAWREKYEDLYSPKYDIKVVVDELKNNPEKIAQNVLKAINNLEKRNGRRR